jgi:hypothetical protein
MAAGVRLTQMCIRYHAYNSPGLSQCSCYIKVSHSGYACLSGTPPTNVTVFYALEDNGLVPSKKIILLIDNEVCTPLAVARSYLKLAKQLFI